jgi:hypothetical protein
VCELTEVSQPTTVYSALGHMHMLGRSIKVELKRGDTLRVTCTHDATLQQKLPQLSKLPPRYVVWGDGSSDEMCAGQMMASATT